MRLNLTRSLAVIALSFTLVSLPIPMQAKIESAMVQLVIWMSSQVCIRL